MKRFFLSILLGLFAFIGFSSADTISVFYNGYNEYQSFTCDGDTSIYLDGNYIYTDSNSLFTPYFNIHYTDGDNQVLIGEYDKSELFLDGQYNKTYTGGTDNYWILTPIDSFDQNIISYQPVFEVTGSIDQNTGNLFNNFSDNALTFLLSNIPSYIQWITLIAILGIVLGIIRRFRR